MDAKTRIYLAGPMTGIPDFNYPLFNLVAARLRDMGHFVLNPAELNPPDVTYRAALSVDLAWIIAHAELLALLPGWESSRGVAVELPLAKALDIPVLEIATDAPGLLVPPGTWRYPGGGVVS